MIKFETTSYIEIPSRKECIDFLITKVIETINSAVQKVEEFNVEHFNLNSQFTGMGLFGFGINISIDEAIRNALVHGNKENPGKKIFITYCVSSEKLEISIEDQGSGFNVQEVLKRLSTSANPEKQGRGILLMKNFMDKVIFNSKGNKVTLIKYRKK